MFDDKPITSSGVPPQNLPVSEPEDLFAQTESEIGSGQIGSNVQSFEPTAASPNSPSALDAGILKPKEISLPPLASSFQENNSAQEQSAMPEMQPLMSSGVKEPAMNRGILVVIIVIVAVLLIGGAGWWVYRYLNIPQVSAPVTETPVRENTTQDEPVSETSSEVVPADSEGTLTNSNTVEVSENVASSSQPVDETILFGEATDTDSDGLDDRREESLGTNPEKSDTDADELTDGDEVIIWGTNPLNPDTDGDSFLDGKEIKAGFSPKGSGKLFEVKATSTSAISTP